MTEPTLYREPGFAIGTLAGLLVLVVLALVVRFRAKTAHGRGNELTEDLRHRLSAYDIAYLCAGGGRVVNAALAGLVESGAVRVDRRHRLHSTGIEATDDYQAALLRELHGGETADDLRSPPYPLELTGLRERLLRAGVLAPRGIQVSLWTIAAAFGVLVLAVASRVYHGGPAGYLVVEVLATALSAVPITTGIFTPLRTKAGDRVVADALGRFRPDAASRVACRGISAYPDQDIAELLAPLPSRGPRRSGRGGGMGGPGHGCGG